MQTALKIQQTWIPQAPHAIGVVLASVVLTLLLIALLVVTGLVAQEFMGGAPLTPLTPEPGLDL